MRNQVINAITEMAEKDNRIMLLDGDLGFNVVDTFKNKYPSRYLNAGISEQNMTSVAAGLALEGNMVFTYSIGNFPTLRCIEQIRNDICYHNANVKILAVGGGFPYGKLGMTHHATEDIAIMRALPNMKVFVPADAVEAVQCLKNVVSFDGPAYIRMSSGREPLIHEENGQIDIDKLVPVKECTGDISVLAAGTVLIEAIKLSEELEKDGILVNVYSVPSVKPIDCEGIKKIAKNCKLMVSMEDHNVIGGLGGAIAEVLSEMDCVHSRLLRIGLNDTYSATVGDQEYIRNCYGISSTKVRDKVLEILGEKN